jgi:ATP-dependent Clp protease ATP-binding subunit ClpA
VYPFERFTDKAKKVLILAQDEAEQAHLAYSDTEQVLTGLLRESDGRAAKVLAALGVDIDNVRVIVATLGGTERINGQQAIPTSRVKVVMEIAYEEATRMNNTYVGTEHLLLGLLIEGEGNAAKILRKLEVHLDKVRYELDSLLKEQGLEEESGSAVEGVLGSEAVRRRGHLKPLGPAAGWLEPETRLSAPARSAVALAEEEAIRAGRGRLGTEHLLLGLIRQGEGRAAEALVQLGVNLAGAREAVAGLEANSPRVPAQPVAGDFDVSLALNQARMLVRRARVAVVDTEHLLLVLCRMPGSGAARALATLGVGSEQVEDQLGAGGGTSADE